MAIVFSKSSNLNNDLWKVTDQVLTALMQDVDSEKTRWDEYVSATFNVKTSTKFGEKTSSLTSFSSYDAVDEGSPAPLDEQQQGFSKLIEFNQFMKKISMTKEMKEDGEEEVMKSRARNLVSSYKRTRAEFASKFMTAGATTFVYGGKTFDATTGDGKALFATDHPGIKSGVAAQSNVFTNAFGSDTVMLNRLANILYNYKNQSGVKQGYKADTIIIPSNVPALEDLIKRIIASEKIVGSGNNDVNTQMGKWTLVVDPLWEVASGAPYIIMSSEANKDLMANLFYDRIQLEVESQVDFDTKNLEYTGRGRMGVGARDWRHALMGGAASGTTLS